MISASTYIFIEDCKENLEYYQGIFGGEIKNVQLTDEVEMFKEHKGKVLHAELHLGESVIHFSDVFGSVTLGNNVKVSLEFEKEVDIRRVYNSLLVNGYASVELQDTFWGALHGNVTDKNGIGWILNFQR
jgi:PhnB protein